MLFHQKLKFIVPLMGSLTLVACGGGSGGTATTSNSNTPPASGLNERVIDASDRSKHTYFNLDTGQVVNLTDAAAATSTDWHVAFKRLALKVNGGASGAGSSRGAVADNQSDFYQADGVTANPSVFLNASPAGELPAINAVTTTTGLTYVTDQNKTQITGDGGTDSWWSYNPAARTVSANPAAWNIVRGADGNSFAKIHVTNIVQASRDITVELFVQGPSDVAFSMTAVTWTAAIGAGGGTKCYDFDTTAEVDCTAQAGTWDLQVEVTPDGRGWNMWTNGGIRGSGTSGASFGTITAGAASGFVSGASIPNLVADAPAGVFVNSTWYEYNLQGGHRIWPNYRVYVIDTGSAQYKLQLTGYYDPNVGTSGFINLRYEAL